MFDRVLDRRRRVVVLKGVSSFACGIFVRGRQEVRIRPIHVTHWLLSSGVTGAAAVALSLDAAAEFLLEGAGLAEVDAVVVLPLDQPVISIALIATAANNHLVDMDPPPAAPFRCLPASHSRKRPRPRRRLATAAGRLAF